MGSGYSIGGVVFGQLFKARSFTSAYKGPTIPDHVDLTGKVFLVTGASSGLGKMLVIELTKRGADVHLISRTMDKLQKVKAEAETQAKAEGKKSGNLSCHSLDMSDMSAVCKFVADFPKDKAIHCLVNNAGALPYEREMVSGGRLEKTTACHVVGPYLLIKGLHAQLKLGNGRVINNASAGLYGAQMDVAALKDGFKTYVKKDNKVDGALVYAVCKRAMLEMSDFLADCYSEDGTVIMTNHPGWCETEGLKPLLDQHAGYGSITFRDPRDGMMGMYYLCVAPEVDTSYSGKFYFDGKAVEKHQMFTSTSSSDRSVNEMIAFCEKFNKLPAGSDGN
ncbi:hypothetical protein SARC_01841 [Sphaeroforma arctica JP610]|uniref:Uncharacterized protein n=1 Tax=Sphaeroforma arctica JP610 TaxID=667725 RepID=A0A0L0GAS2_9EUKA|nr:hypothetical protein SARC_01841 [Sphaeroforma arctica JP610]KNC85996.1 hypothetical protein SARC_01841 [Sphaeroforma arctica JP610]|eukprot:XP_014159898.1 hypothetical protein SARC_01841 [Sphaeroforma arctica JP610]